MKIVAFFKRLFKVKKDNLFSLNVGDIIWAKRYKDDMEKSKIKIGHQESPYVIVKKEKGKVYGLQSTSNPHQEVEWKMLYYPLGRLSYDMPKNSYISCLKCYQIKDEQFIKVIGHLNAYDLNQLKKQLYILIRSDFDIKPHIEEKYLDFKIGVGDVILYKGIRYYITDIINKEFVVYKLRKSIKKGKRILINNTYYSFVFEKEEMIPIKEKYTLVDTFNTGEREFINNYKKEYLERFRKKISTPKSLRKGAIIDYNDNMFYIYDENENNLFTYRIFSFGYSQKGLIGIIVDNGYYKTFFNTNVLSRQKLEEKTYRIRRCASAEEVEHNDKLFQMTKKERGEKQRKDCVTNTLNKKHDINDFVPMVVIKNTGNQNYYLIISRKKNIIEVVNINDMSDLYYFELNVKSDPFVYHRILTKEEFENYIIKIKAFKDVVATFSR